MNRGVRAYLGLYNLVALSLWLTVLLRALVHWRVSGLAWPRAEGAPAALVLQGHLPMLVTAAQLMSAVEILNAMWGYTKTSPFAAVIQNASRLFVCGVVWRWGDLATQGVWPHLCVAAWCIAEVARYPFYLGQLLTAVLPGRSIPAVLVHIRYNAFVLLYPIGTAAEVFCIANFAADCAARGWRLNSSQGPENFWVQASSLCYAVLLTYVYGFQHLWWKLWRHRGAALDRLRKQQSLAQYGHTHGAKGYRPKHE